MTPLVSIIIPTYNRPQFLEEAIASVAKQTIGVEKLEILVIDDGSKENYAEATAARFPNTFYHYKKNGGLSSARNYGTKLATGKYIGLLDDDDVWMPDKLERQLEAFQKKPWASCIHSSCKVIDEWGKLTGRVIGSPNKKVKREGYVFWDALGTWVIKSPTPLFKREVFDKILFDESIKVGEDIDFYQRMFYYFKIAFIDEPLALYRNYSHDVQRLSQKKIEYLGIEFKLYENLEKQGLKNPFIKYLILRRLILKASNRKNKLFPDSGELSLGNLLLPSKKKLELLSMKPTIN